MSYDEMNFNCFIRILINHIICKLKEKIIVFFLSTSTEHTDFLITLWYHFINYIIDSLIHNPLEHTLSIIIWYFINRRLELLCRHTWVFLSAGAQRLFRWWCQFSPHIPRWGKCGRFDSSCTGSAFKDFSHLLVEIKIFPSSVTLDSSLVHFKSDLL